ncbi:MAG: tetratricopeptide repeat protein [Treponemataceae bacterium]|uniref:tetratricopeptide repeat protein n=1 Tax=Treponema sp. J25 TaxID=2094121 RepID=UPI001045EB01|nr:tetratricopeptide repeat protein [Treponema sp. J25]MCX7949309.1 tetratricopeptide repeat protein [Treponemataceae bacterium]TCW60890.1 hypothetical protein C5O22_09565 [Treponema sp. J25]
MGGSLQNAIRLYRARRFDVALEELLQLDSRSFSEEEKAELAYYLGLCYTKLEQFDDALLYLEQVVTNGKDPLRMYQCRLALAYVYAVTGRSKLAEFELQRLISQGFESVQLYAALAYTFYMQKQYEEAIDYYSRALELDRENPTALNGLGYVLADTEKDVRRALILCKRAVDKKPHNPAYLDSLGWAHFKNGNIPESKIWIRRALDLLPDHPEIQEHMRRILRAES